MSGVRILGAADPVEVAVVLALLARQPATPPSSPYDRWREQRLRAVGRRKAVKTPAW